MQQWPFHRNNEVVGILAEEKTSTHRLLLREDGTISTCLDLELLGQTEAPGYLYRAAQRPGDLLGREERDALRRLLDKADELEAVKPS